MMERYGEILILGKCNLNCYYCLQNELKTNVENSLNTHYLEWVNFQKWLDNLKENNINHIIISSITTDPLLYNYIDELVDYLLFNNFLISIRTNGVLAEQKITTLQKINGEVSFSVNSLSEHTNRLIQQRHFEINYDYIISNLKDKNIRISIVVNKHNYYQIFDIINYFAIYDNVEYIQLRKLYKEYKIDTIEESYYFKVKTFIKDNCKRLDNYYSSECYIINGKKVSLWDTVFPKTDIISSNYFTNGKISEHNLLIPIYNNECD